MAVAEESKLQFSSAEYYIGLLSLGRGHYVARLDIRAPGSLRHAARLETSWPGQWLRYLAAVVSICEYTVSNKGGLPCHCHDCGHIFCEGNCPPPPFHRLCTPVILHISWGIKGRVISHLDCQGVMTPSSGPPISTSCSRARKFFL